MNFKTYAPIPMVPGPVSLNPRTLQAMNCDYGPGELEDDFLPFYRKVSVKYAEMARTANDVVMMTGEGMLGLWAGLKSCLAPGEKVLALGTGVFGDGIGQMAASFGCEVKALSFPYSSTLNQHLQQIEDAVRQFRPKMITAVHCETPSGTLNPLAEIGEIKQRLGVPLFYVDAVASWGGAELETDAWNIDILLGGSQKCLSAPPSMTMVAVSGSAWEVMEKVGYQGYDSLLPWRDIYRAGLCPYTPYWHGLAALNAAADAIFDEGLDACFARHRQVAEMCRAGLLELGISLFPEEGAVQSPTVTAAYIPSGYNFKTWQAALRERGLVAGGSFGPMLDKVFRLGHMGTQADAGQMRRALTAIEDVLKE
ncbi:MAG: alanine--glyoxylate aminotransferase family protein [Desulfovibrionaceae bacterium]|nr:alanine--glyoxylate aminotransferase family protein [Desulfovibrionaceae bacterium]